MLIFSFPNLVIIVNSGELGSRNDGATPISNRRALSDDITNFPSIDYIILEQINNRVHCYITPTINLDRSISYRIK
ncbi:palindromic element RPE2 domain-containing protein [Candidatus Tisiphia endosymbiont of Mystacides longicornis]|uniref:palindromic element RPE2 domain-containing protein n=1 Tax=Candidatus Tisiphia endosymbiont of Mystacides longicornis TaxID=3139330 RepID=UPI003CCB677F